MTMTMPTHDEMMARFYARDRASNGRFVTGVLTTGIYCLPSCSARKPRAENVRFFPGEPEARAAGLRPCRRCRPDDFYRDYDPDLHLLATLVSDVRRRPADFGDVGRMVAASGIGATKLGELFRRHWHLSPAAFLARERVRAACRLLASDEGATTTEVAFAVGFESLSAFHENFRRLTAMTPGDYRRLGSSAAFTLALPADYPADAMLRALGRDPGSLTERVEGPRLTRAVRLGGEPALLRVELANGIAHCQVEAKGSLSADAMREAHGLVLRILGLTWEPGQFVRLIQRRADLARLVEGRRGLRIPLVPGLFEGLVWTIVGQQVNLPFAFALRRVVIELCGDDAGDGLRAHPGPEAVSTLDYGDLTSRRFSGRKAEYLIDTARLAASGELPLDALADMPATEVERRLLAVRGLGPWSAQYVMMRAIGFADCVPVGDAGLVAALQRFFGLDRRPNPVETLGLMEPFAPFRSLATFHLWTSLGDPE